MAAVLVGNLREAQFSHTPCQVNWLSVLISKVHSEGKDVDARISSP
ncbi:MULTISPECIES: hypothetical protein [unclassified Mesorhizobium]|nr:MULTISPECIES: hypothetical protein [unclassified Mesorhizobium]